MSRIAGDTPEELERLLRRAELASARLGSGVSVDSRAAEQAWQEVLANAKSTLQKRPQDDLALRCAARALLSTGGDSAQIRDYAQRAVANGNGGTGFTLGYTLHAYLGTCHEREQDAAGAEQHYAAALSSKPGDETAMLGLARALLQRMETARVSDASKLAQMNAVLFCLGQACLKTSQHEEAARLLKQCLALQPTNNASAMQMLEGLLMRAREESQAVLQVDPTNAAALLKMAMSWRQDPRGHLDEALKGYQQVLVISPSNADALEGSAYCHHKKNNLDEAMRLYQQCLRVKSTAESPLYCLGDILYKHHRHAECQHYLGRLVETNCAIQYKTGALHMLAKSHVAVDDYDQAERYARAGLLEKPEHPQFLFILALVKHKMAEYDSSASLLKEALRLCGSAESQLRVDIHDWLAQAYERKKDYKAAMAELDIAQQQDPLHSSSLITRGLVHIQLEQLDQAEAAFQRALTVERNHALALVRLGYCKLLCNDHQEATQLFQRALEQCCGTVALPRSVKGLAHIYMALSFIGQSNTDEALVQLAEARNSHRNFKTICTRGEEVIVKGEGSGLVQQIRSIADLHVNISQAWQLVHLMAKELGFDRWEPANSAQQTPSEADIAMARPSVVGATAGTVYGGGATAFASSTAAGTAVLAPPKSGALHGAIPDACIDRQCPGDAQRRQWAAPAPNSAPQAAPEKLKASSELPTGLKLRLNQEELIDFSLLTTRECLGTGGFGAVYRGYLRDKEVAIKKLFCEDSGNMLLEELEQEIAALRGLHHPRLVAFIGACLSPPNLWIVTEYMPNGNLHHLLHEARTPLTCSTQAKIALQVSEGVAFLHSLIPPVVHRDLKSLNIVLDHSYSAKICDFGLTQSMERTHISLKDGGNDGSPRYMAPECYDGKVTEKVDVWAMGCIIVESFGGPLPYDDCTQIAQIVAKVLVERETPYIPHHLPRGVRPIIEDCFHFDVAMRTHAQDVFNRLQKLHLAPVCS